MTLLEAMSLGKPCVVTNVGGNPEIAVDYETGLIRSSNDTEKFASAIIDLLKDENFRIKLGNSGKRRYLKHFSIGNMIENYEDLYSDGNP